MEVEEEGDFVFLLDGVYEVLDGLDLWEVF